MEVAPYKHAQKMIVTGAGGPYSRGGGGNVSS